MPKFYLGLLVVCFIWGCAAKTTKAIDADALRKEIEALCVEGGRKEDIVYFIENGDNAKAREIVRQLKWQKLEGCDDSR
jgi:hypothetical protein